MNPKHFKIPTTLFVLLMLISQAYAQLDPEREKMSREYIRQFAEDTFALAEPNTHQALINAMSKIPKTVFEDITQNERPIVFVHHYTQHIARFANSTEFIVEADDPPTFVKGFFLVNLGDELNSSSNIQAIEGVIYHEIAHRVLENLRSDREVCDLEREANQLIKAWGLQEEFLQAKEVFGAKKKGDSPCHDKIKTFE